MEYGFVVQLENKEREMTMLNPASIKRQLFKGDVPRQFLQGFKKNYKINDLRNCLHSFILLESIEHVKNYINHV